jgi:hypothetical protein
MQELRCLQHRQPRSCERECLRPLFVRIRARGYRRGCGYRCLGGGVTARPESSLRSDDIAPLDGRSGIPWDWASRPPASYAPQCLSRA